jgi:5-methylcytosine-specific restriction enzyme subunit McrC
VEFTWWESIILTINDKCKPEKIIIDAKFYKSTLQEYHGKSSFHSHNMYQMFTYLMHQPRESNVRGVLVYPFNGVEVDEKFWWDERVKLEYLTINLDNSWRDIYGKLFGILA